MKINVYNIMCTTIRLQVDGNDLETVSEFEAYFDVDASKYMQPYYEFLVFDACLCQINLDKFFQENNHLPYEKDCGDWYEVNNR